MKVFALLFVLTINQIFAAGVYSQNARISLNLTKTTIADVLSEIEKKSEFSFVYNNKLIDVEREVNINVKDKDIYTILDLLFENTDVEYVVDDRHIILSNQLNEEKNQAQPSQPNSTIKGNVTTTKGDPIPGVTVIVVGTTNGTITDIDGNYTLSDIPGKASLTFSFVGMKTVEIPVEGRATINVALEEENIGLDEVVAVGYGIQKRKEVIGTVSSVQGSDLAKVPVTTAAEAITGKLAGVQVVTTSGAPDADIKIRVRGGGSITQDNSPLYIIDGFPVDNGLSMIAPSDIERIDVLKDASSTAIYGARGANGVVIITTKGGSNNSRTNVSFDIYTGVKRIEKQIDMMSPYDYVVSAWERTRIDANDLSATSMVNFIERYGEWDTYASTYGNDAGTDWQDEMFRTAVVQNYNFNINGGNNTTKYNMGISHIDEDGVLLGSSYKRTIINAKMEHKANEHLSLGFSTRYNNNTTYGGAVSTQNVLMYRPTEGLTGALDLDDFDEEYLSTTDLINPVLLSEELYRKKGVQNYNVMGEISYKLGNFVFKSQAGIDSYSLKSESFDGPYTKNAIANNGPFVSVSTTSISKWINTNTINWNKLIDGKHNINILVGQEWSDSRTKEFSITVYEFPEYITAEKALGSLSLGDSPEKPTTSESSYQLFSFFGRASYDYKGKYLFNTALRVDGSSKFAKKNRWGYFPSAGAAWRVTEEDFMKDINIISNLKLRYSFGMSGNDRIDDLLWTTPWITDATTQYGLNNELTAALKPSTLANPDIKWETTISNDIGIELGLYKNRLNFTFDLYNNKTIDLLLDSSLPANSGFSTQTQNVGSTRNRGLEVLVDGTIINKKDFSWSAGFNIAFNRNKVLALSEGVEERYESSGISTAGPKNEYIVKVGEPVGQMYGYVYDGWYSTDDFEEGSYNSATKYWTRNAGVPYETAYTPRPGDVKFKDMGGNTDSNGDPTITDDDKVVIGNANPKHFGGFNTTVKYKGVDLSAYFNWSYGNDVYNATKLNLYNGKVTETNMPTEMINRFTYIGDDGEPITSLSELNERNKNATFYAPYRGTFVFHSGLVEDGSFLRLNTLTLGYTLPKAICQRILVQNFRIYCTANNLFCWTKYSGFDPEVDELRDSPLTPGVDYWGYPKSRGFIAGINLTF